MGDRYRVLIKCVDCGDLNEHYHAESSGYMDFVCSKCKKVNWVTLVFVARIVGKRELKKLYKEQGFE